jgi:competence protein ComEA
MNSTISKNTTNGTRSGASRSHPSAALLPGIRLRRGLALIAALMLALSGVAQAAESMVRLSGVVNLNTANAEQLQMLPGVGEKKAAAIIEVRSAKGGFKAIEEIVEVKGVGDALLERLKPHLTLSGKTTARLL